MLPFENSSVPILQVCIGKWPPAIGWDEVVENVTIVWANGMRHGNFSVLKLRGNL